MAAIVSATVSLARWMTAAGSSSLRKAAAYFANCRVSCAIRTHHPRPHRRAATASIHALSVEPQQVVLGKTESADGSFSTDAGMWPVPVVAVQPVRQLASSLA